MTYESFYYKSQNLFLVAVDCIIFGFHNNEIKLLVHPRAMEPEQGGLSLMGGFVRKDESVDQAASYILSNLTGLENIFMEQVKVYGELNRDPGERVITCAYYSLIDINAYDESLLKNHHAFWVSLDKASDLIFDHYQMVKDALAILRRKAVLEPIGFNLLSEKFTLTQLQSLYEAIYGKPMDKRNFRKKMLSFGFINKLEEVDKSGSKKGAYYYKFNDRNLLNNSINYEF
jgi:ADP-ribose pyrophosphatase YjhB (NUDIX family)